MSHLQAKQSSDKKRQSGDWSSHSGKKNGSGKKSAQKPGGHVNKYAQHSRASERLLIHEMDKQREQQSTARRDTRRDTFY